MHLTDKIRNWMKVNKIDFKTYEQDEMYSFFIKNTNNYNVTFKQFKECVYHMQRNPSKRKEPQPVLRKVVRQCTKCHKEFETEIDSFGIPYSTRCNICKTKEKGFTKYYEKLGSVRA
jgi:hypothetical protein